MQTHDKPVASGLTIPLENEWMRQAKKRLWGIPSETESKTMHLGVTRLSILMGEIFSGDFNHNCPPKPEEPLFFLRNVYLETVYVGLLISFLFLFSLSCSVFFS